MPPSPAAAKPLRASADAAAYRLDIPRDERARLATGWLLLGLAALVFSGLFSILLVVSRTPGLKDLIPVADFFHVALVAHVDLSVLVWFLSFAGVLWSLNGTRQAMGMARAALALAIAGTVLLGLAPFTGSARPVLANYIPVIDNGAFLGGLVVFAVGMGLLVLRSLAFAPRVGTAIDGAGAVRFGLNASVIATAVALIALLWSWVEVPVRLDAKTYYELLFWGSGHVLQFTWTLLMLVAWLVLASALGRPLALSPRVATLLLGIALVSVFATPLIYLAHPVTSVEHHKLQTWLMRFGGGIAIPPIAIAIAWALRGRRRLCAEERPLHAALVASMVLLVAGGLIGFAIRGANVRIPAHYHGCIVGVTLALMGLAYHLLPRLGFRAPRSRLAAWQPWLYGGGQLLHILGLVWSGGYGVERKVAGAAQILRTPQELAGMGLMGLGGLIAIAGGLAFVVVMIGCLRSRVAGNPP
jgi:hypothetical protein